MRKIFLLFLTFLICFCFSYPKEKVFLEKSGKGIFIKKVEIPEYNKHKKHKRIKKREGFYVFSKRGKVFHRPDCKFARKIKNKIIVKTREEALRKGLKPCRFCKP